MFVNVQELCGPFVLQDRSDRANMSSSKEFLGTRIDGEEAIRLRDKNILNLLGHFFASASHAQHDIADDVLMFLLCVSALF
jgi:hypothetical protein